MTCTISNRCASCVRKNTMHNNRLRSGSLNWALWIAILIVRQLVILIFAIISKQVIACSCNEFKGELQEEVVSSYLDADAVVLANVVDRHPEGNGYEITSFAVSQSWKGKIESSFTTRIYVECCACGTNFDSNEKYVLYLYGPSDSGHYKTDVCSRTKKYSSADKKEIDLLNGIDVEILKHNHKKLVKSRSIPRFFDAGIAGIVDVTGSSEKLVSKFVPCDTYEDWSKKYCFTDKDKKYLLEIELEKIKGFFKVVGIAVSRNEESNGRNTHVYGSKFLTDQGLGMKMTMDSLKAKLGNPDKVYTYESDVAYLYTTFENTALFKKHSILGYRAEYSFESGVLVQLVYSYLYPENHEQETKN